MIDKIGCDGIINWKSGEPGQSACKSRDVGEGNIRQYGLPPGTGWSGGWVERINRLVDDMKNRELGMVIAYGLSMNTLEFLG